VGTAQRRRILNLIDWRKKFMKFITTKTETSLADLARQVFDAKSSKAATDLKQAQAALREANPQLGNAAKLPAGTLVIVPEVPGTRTAPAQSLTGVNADTVTRLRTALAGAKAVLDGSAVSRTQEAETTMSLAKNRTLISLVKQLPDLQSRLSQIAAESKIQIKQMDSEKTSQLEALRQLESDLGKMIL
jgi:hypothetical protein